MVKGQYRRTTKLKPTVSIVGAGRLGTALARALASRGYRIEAVVARSKQHARRAADLTDARAVALAPQQLDNLPASDILFITTPDDAIEETAERLAALWKDRGAKMRSADKKKRDRRIVLHASGALSSAILLSLRGSGFATGSIHPLVSVSDPVHGAESLGSAFFCIEGEPQARRVARLLVRALGAKSFSVSTKDKALYHAAAVMASGHVTALFDIAAEMLVRCGLTKTRSREVFLPLLRSTLENLYLSDPAHALTGTFARADTATVRRHLAALTAERMTDALAAYRLLGLYSLRLAKAAGAPLSALEEIERLLATADTEKNKFKI